MPPKVEKHKLDDVIEIKEIKKLIKKHKCQYDLMTIFEWMETIVNKEINGGAKQPVELVYEETSEEEEELELSDHESDED